MIAVGFTSLIENCGAACAATLYGGAASVSWLCCACRGWCSCICRDRGLAMTDHLFGQFLGQDILRRLSRRLGEGAFNGAPLGIAAIEVIRPLPYLGAKPPRVRDVLGEVLRPMFGSRKNPEASRSGR